MIKRIIAAEITKAAEKMPVICVTGPRQSGKTTLVKYLFSDYVYYNLEFLTHREFAQQDAMGFLESAQKGIIIDEVQRVPELLSSIQYFVDEEKKQGKIILTGSQNILLMQEISQTLAGRVALFTLLPFSMRELQHTSFEEKEYENYLVKSFYPRVYDESLDPVSWLQDYISTYVERDVRQAIAVRNLSLFTNFLKLCAGHTGQVVNYSTFSNNLGVDVNTIKTWLSILETSYIIFLQPPFFKNYNKRIIKSPKLYFYDAGLACNLLGLTNANDYTTHYLKGGLFESFIIAELHKYMLNHKLNGRIYYFRDSNGNEIDVILEMKNQLKAIEIKSGKTIAQDFFKGLNYWGKLSKETNPDKYIIYGGKEMQNRSQASILSWNSFSCIFQ